MINRLKDILKLFQKDNRFLLKVKYERFKRSMISTSKQFGIYAVLIILYLVNSVLVSRFFRRLPIPRPSLNAIQVAFSRFYLDLAHRLEGSVANSISRLELIHLALRNMHVKKTRTYITIGGVALGIGAIVFLVSIGYGLRGLVLSRVARLDELKQTDVSVQPGSKVKINDRVLADAKSLPNVVEAYPVIAVVGRVNYQNSISDVAVYGVTTGYLKNSSISTSKGKLFDSDVTTISSSITAPTVAGAQDTRVIPAFGNTFGKAKFAIEPNNWLRVRSGPSVDASIIGYTRRGIGTASADLVWGSTYITDDIYGDNGVDDDDNKYGTWLKSDFNIWEEKECDTLDPDCVDGKYLLLRDATGDKVTSTGYIARIGVSVELINEDVLGINTIAAADDQLIAQALTDTDTTSAVGTTSPPGGLLVIPDAGDPNSEWVVVPDETGDQEADAVKNVSLPSTAVQKAVVNKAMLRLISLDENNAVGSKFSVSYIIPSNLLENQKDRVESIPAEYEIVGVTIDDTSPIFYVPFVDLRSLGITNYSQFKVLGKDETVLPKIRQQIEAMGFITQSVQDTVEQINSLFSTIVLVLGAMGMIALAVASLGMFNTLTVSLLERTREVGLMKAMGMRTEEVKQLFLIESMIMGFASGLFGLLVGYMSGKILSLGLTIFSVAKGQGFINVSQIPFSFVVLILVLSLLVGLFTGIFPARRSKNISALNALRYE